MEQSRPGTISLDTVKVVVVVAGVEVMIVIVVVSVMMGVVALTVPGRRS